jgi:cyclopropane-fatty-acyl-phospholipid synthase
MNENVARISAPTADEGRSATRTRHNGALRRVEPTIPHFAGLAYADGRAARAFFRLIGTLRVGTVNEGKPNGESRINILRPARRGGIAATGGRMTDDTKGLQSDALFARTTGPKFARSSLGKHAHRFDDSPISFQVTLPDGTVRRFGRAAPRFTVTLKNSQGLRALTSLDEGRIGEAYLAGDLDFDGDMLAPFALRGSLKDTHPVLAIWRFLQPLLFGQIHTNKQAIAAHYEMDPDFFLSFLDPKKPIYTQGMYENAHETLEAATLRKFDYCFEKLGLKAGDHMLEIGPGWGAWFEYASQRGVKCTGITISPASIDYLESRAKALGHDWEVINVDLLDYRTDRKYDAIVIMGVIEHLPDYEKVLDKFLTLVKPGGKIFLDGSADTKKYKQASFIVKYIYSGNHSYMVLHDFLKALAQTPLEILELINDRDSYFHTALQWARNFDRNRDAVIARFGEFNYRRFRLYLWGTAYQFLSRGLSCYRMIIHSPGAPPSSGEHLGASGPGP